LKQMT